MQLQEYERMNNLSASPARSPVTSDVLKAKREKLLLARTAPVENSDEKPELLPMPIRSSAEEDPVTKKRKRMTVSHSECGNKIISSLKKSSPWKSMDSPASRQPVEVFLPTRTSRRLTDKKKKEVRFGGVEVYYFDRKQSYSVVPTTQGASLGMEDKHHSSKNYSFYEFARASTRQNEKKWAVIRKVLQDKQKPRRSPRKATATVKFAAEVSTGDEITNTVKEVVNTLVNAVAEEMNKSDVPTLDEVDAALKIIIDANSDSDDDEDIPFAEPELLQPLDGSVRLAILEQSNVPFDPTDDRDCQLIRISRTKCGCSCKNGLCLPNVCECSINGIKCQVDLKGFPCACLDDANCGNPEGRSEFNPLRVKTHYKTTLKLLQDMEKMDYKFIPSNICKHESETSTSYLSTPSSPAYQRQTTVQLTTDLTVGGSTTINASANSITIAQVVNNNNIKNTLSDTTPQNEPIASVMGTPLQQLLNEEKVIQSRRKYPVTPTYKREKAVYELAEHEPTEPIFPPTPSLLGPSGLRRSPRNSPMKRAFPPTSMTSIVVVGNCNGVSETPSPKRARKVPTARSILVNFSQTIDEENFPFEALEQPESSKYEGNGT